VTLLLLGAVFVPGIGTDHNTGARRWLGFGFLSFQPSEMAKVALAIFLAAFLARDPERIRKFTRGFLPAIAAVGAAAGLVVLQPDVGSALLLTAVLSMVLFVAGARPLHFAPFVLIGGLCLAYVVATHPYITQRLQAWTDPWNDTTGRGHQIRQSLTALGSGGLVGSGPGRGIQKFGYLPEGHTDFILAILGEELGFLGAAGIVLLYACLGFVGWRIMRRCRDPFAFHLSFGLTAFILFQAAVNIAVVTAAVPTKGIPLPFLSYGGTSLVFSLGSLGILMRVSETERGECESSSPEVVPAVISSRGSH
jgi:cell division protein FtsW